MKAIEKVGKTVDEAITEALIDLGASTDQVNIEIISKGSKGFMGFGVKEAKVRVTLKEEQEGLTLEALPKVKPIPKVEPIQEVKKVEPILKKEVKKEMQKGTKKETRRDSEDAVVVKQARLTCGSVYFYKVGLFLYNKVMLFNPDCRGAI